MAFRLNTGRLQQWSSACSNNQAMLRACNNNQAQLTRSESLKHHDVLGREYLGVSCRYLRKEAELAFRFERRSLSWSSCVVCLENLCTSQVVANIFRNLVYRIMESVFCVNCSCTHYPTVVNGLC